MVFQTSLFFSDFIFNWKNLDCAFFIFEQNLWFSEDRFVLLKFGLSDTQFYGPQNKKNGKHASN